MKLLHTNLISICDKEPIEKISYGVKMVGAPLEWPETMGENIKIGIIDTGIDPYHEDLRSNIYSMKNFTKSRIAVDENGHGTHVAGIAAAAKNNRGVVGVAPRAKLCVAKAFEKDGSALQEGIIAAIKWLCDMNVSIINMSFSSDSYTDPYYYCIEDAYQKGVCFICAAGNDGHSPRAIGYPAKFQETISVTAVDLKKQHASFSSVGPYADIAAAGVDIYSTYPKNRYATLSGTSMATPLISGSVALMQAKAKRRLKQYLTPQQVRLLLSMYAEEYGLPGKDAVYGYGIFSFGRLEKSDFILDKTTR